MPKKSFFYILHLLIFILSISTQGCSNSGGENGFGEEHKTAETISFPADGIQTIKIARSVYRSDIDFDFTATGTIKVTAKKTINAATEELSEKFKKEFIVHSSIDNGTLQIETGLPQKMGTEVYGRIDYEISAPGGTNLNIRATSGKVAVAPGAGKLDIETVNSAISVTGPTGPSRLKTDNGAIEVSDCGGAVDIFSINGSVDVKSCPHSTVIRSVNSKITFNTGAPPTADMDISSPNGDIDITLPQGSELDITAETLAGNISMNIPVVSLEEKDKTIHSVMNSPTHILHLKTINSSINIASD